MDSRTLQAKSDVPLTEVERLDQQCEWHKHEFECSAEVIMLRKRRKTLIEQASEEVKVQDH